MSPLRVMIGLIAAVGFGLLSARPVHAQVIQGTVIDSASLRPIAGSIVMVVDVTGASLARTITNQRGVFRLSVPSGAARIRVLHIGFRPASLAVPALVSGAGRVDVILALLGTVLEPIEVRDNPNCSVRRDRAQALALWEQARLGLLAMIVAREAMPAQLKRLRFRRVMDGTSDHIVRQEVTVDTVTGAARPFQASRSATEFVRDGFVDRRSSLWTYYAPDAEVMLEDAFFAGYCFRVMEPQRSRPGQVGVGFAPAKRRAANVEIDGAFWIDTTARALTAIEFRYVGLDGRVESHRPGGRVEFREMPNGVVVIDRWALRLISVQLDTVYVMREPSMRRSRDVVAEQRATFEVHETGGELASAAWSDGTRWQASLGTLRLEARTHEGSAAVGTTISLEHTDYRGSVDSSGLLVFNDLLPGPYRVIVHDTLLAHIDVTLKTMVAFVASRDSVHRAYLDVPTAEDYAMALCPGVVSRQSVAFFAYLTTPAGKPLRDIEVKEMLKRPLETPQWRSTAFGGRSDEGGRYFSCWRYVLDDVVQIWLRPDGLPAQLVLKKLTGRVNVVPVVIRH